MFIAIVLGFILLFCVVGIGTEVYTGINEIIDLFNKE